MVVKPMNTNYISKENYDNREDENIFLIPAQFVVDPENAYNITETPVNSRTPSVIVRTVVDTVHPKQSGYLDS